MYREHEAPNTSVRKRPETMTVEIVAAADIEEGEEITLPGRRPVSQGAPVPPQSGR